MNKYFVKDCEVDFPRTKQTVSHDIYGLPRPKQEAKKSKKITRLLAGKASFKRVHGLAVCIYISKPAKEG